MIIYFVAGASPAWRASGYGASLLAGDASRLLVSFVEFNQDARRILAADEMPRSYTPDLNKNRTAVEELGKGLLPLLESHADEILNPTEKETSNA